MADSWGGSWGTSWGTSWGATTPPPTNTAIIAGLVMVDLGLTILVGGLSPQLHKGLVEDEQNLIPRF